MRNNKKTDYEKAHEKLLEALWKLENLALDMINDSYVDLGWYQAQKESGSITEEENAADIEKTNAITAHINDTISFLNDEPN